MCGCVCDRAERLCDLAPGLPLRGGGGGLNHSLGSSRTTTLDQWSTVPWDYRMSDGDEKAYGSKLSATHRLGGTIGLK